MQRMPGPRGFLTDQEKENLPKVSWDLINETLSVSGSMLTKLFTREKSEYDRFVKVNGEVTKLALKEQLSGRWFRLVMGIFTQLGPLLIYFAGGYLIIARGEAGPEIIRRGKAAHFRRPGDSEKSCHSDSG